MTLKEFFKPTKIKLILTILLLAPVAYYLFDKAFWFCRIVERGLGMGLDINCFLSEFIPKIIIYAIVIYFFSCLVERLIKSVKRKQKKETAIWLACLIGMVIGVVLVSYIRTGIHNTLSCKKSEALIREQIEEANYCQSDEDCASADVYLGCPFGCGKYLNREAVTSITEQVSSYIEQCGECINGCGWSLNPVCQNQKCVEIQAFCQPDRIYVDLSECSCPSGTTKTIETPQGGEEAVLICKTDKTQTTCKDDDFYAQQAMSFKYKVQDSSVTVSGCLANNPGSPCQEKTLNLAPTQAFYLSSGKEQSVKVTLQKIENKKAYFLFSYGAAPPACETVGGCDYACEFVKE